MSITKLIGAGVALGCLAIAYAPSVYELHKIEIGAERQLNALVDVKKSPGPHLIKNWYIPFAWVVTEVQREDNRLREYEDRAEQIPTKDDKFMKSDRFAKWRVEDPFKYIPQVKHEERAQTILDKNVFARVWAEMSNHTFEQNQHTKRQEIRQKAVEGGNEAMAKYGIEIVDIRIKRTDIPSESRGAIHKGMIAEVRKQAAFTRAEGEAARKRILGQMEAKVQLYVSDGQRQVEEILGEAEGEVAKYYNEVFSQDPEFYKFWETLRTYEVLAESKPNLIISTGNPLLSGILQGGEPSKKAKGKREYRRSKAKALELEEGMVDGEIGTKKPKEEARKVEEKPTAPKVAPSDGQEPKK